MSELNILDEPVFEDMDPEVARYENMPMSQVKRELREHGIDPAPTVAAVTRLIESSLTDRQDPEKRR